VNDLEPDLNNISLDSWSHPVFQQNGIRVDVLRLDKIHPEISGNKWFKLKYYLEKAIQLNKKKLVSFGGAYSNHLLALAAAANRIGYKSLGLIRGEEPSYLSQTLITAREYGMELQFLSRVDYNERKRSLRLNECDEKDVIFIPEGGAGEEGRRGAGEILSVIPTKVYTHVCTAVGTGTTLAGLINSAAPGQKIIGVSVLKGTSSFQPLDRSWLETQTGLSSIQMHHNFHFGGYAKSTQPLIDFMNRLFKEYGIPTDRVYTGKLFFAVLNLADLKVFPEGSRILILHTGGLQGNRTLKPGLLQF
jgi:1-aminocyclopropane-1-carboxylate deaminase